MVRQDVLDLLLLWKKGRKFLILPYYLLLALPHTPPHTYLPRMGWITLGQPSFSHPPLVLWGAVCRQTFPQHLVLPHPSQGQDYYPCLWTGWKVYVHARS